MAKHLTLTERVERLESRNARVEANKAWETSFVRRISIMIATYLTVAFYLRFVVHIKPWVNAFVPVIGYFLSTLTIGRLKQMWFSRRLDR